MDNHYILLIDKYSNFKRGGKDFTRYGSKGDKVTLIRDSGEALIVKGKEPFSVKKEEVKKV